LTDAKETPQERRERFLRLAAEAEATALRQTDLPTKIAWLDLAKSWAAMAQEIPSGER